jgi:protease-4
MAGVFAGLLLFVIGVPVLLIGFAAASARPSGPPVNSILSLDLRTAISDQEKRGPLAFLSSDKLSVAEITRGLRRAETDANIKALLVRLPEGGMAPATADEIRTAIRHFRGSGKLVVAHSQGIYPSGITSATYMVGASADQFWMQPSASLQSVGLSTSEMFFKRAFDKYGVVADYEQRYEYKNAVNPYLHDDYTPAHRESTLSWLGSVYGAEIGLAAQDRKQDPDKLRATLEAGPYDAEQALKLGLIDRVGEVQEAQASLRGLVHEGEAHFIDFASYHPAEAPGATDAIAVIGAEGEIVTGTARSSGFSEASGVFSDDVARAFRQAVDDKSVKAIVFRVSSPGGSDTASEQILSAVKAAKAAGKPVVVSMGTYAASGGYWISSGASEIIANPTTLTGSIGVFGGKMAYGPALARFGVDTRQITIGNDYAGAFGTGQGFSPAQRAAFSGWMDKIYSGFVHRVAEGRKLPEERVREIAKGRVWTGVQAKDLGLVDQLGGFDLAVSEAKRLAGLKADASVSLRYLPESKGLFEGFGQAVETGADSARALVTMGRMLSDPQTRAAVRDLQRLNARPQDASVLAPGLE